jgi:hypothetical protein
MPSRSIGQTIWMPNRSPLRHEASIPVLGTVDPLIPVGLNTYPAAMLATHSRTTRWLPVVWS